MGLKVPGEFRREMTWAPQLYPLFPDKCHLHLTLQLIQGQLGELHALLECGLAWQTRMKLGARDGIIRYVSPCRWPSGDERVPRGINIDSRYPRFLFHLFCDPQHCTMSATRYSDLPNNTHASWWKDPGMRLGM